MGFINDVVLEHRYTSGVPCPRCGQEMTKIREAVQGEYDPDEQEALVEQVRPLKIRMVPWQDQQQKDKSGKGFLTEEDLAKRFGVPVSAIQRLVREKKLGFIQLTKRKKVFTQELVDEFFRRESGLRARHGPVNNNPFGPKPNQNAMSIEESRKLLNEILKEP